MEQVFLAVSYLQEKVSLSTQRGFSNINGLPYTGRAVSVRLNTVSFAYRRKVKIHDKPVKHCQPSGAPLLLICLLYIGYREITAIRVLNYGYSIDTIASRRYRWE